MNYLKNFFKSIIKLFMNLIGYGIIAILILLGIRFILTLFFDF